MYKLIAIVSLLSFALRAQDKLFFTNGTVQTGILVSMTKSQVYFKTTDTSAVQNINKKDLLLVENYRGVRYLFAEQTATTKAPEKTTAKRNLVGIQPFGLLTGRATVLYERFTPDDKIGFVIPFSLTFDPVGALYNSQIDTSANAVKRINGVNFITGVDVNFYFGKRDNLKFFIGPRLRYGTDLFLRGIEAYSLQTQFGWRFGAEQSRFAQHISLGFGFARIIESPAGRLINPKQAYGWYSINYRLGIRW